VPGRELQLRPWGTHEMIFLEPEFGSSYDEQRVHSIGVCMHPSKFGVSQSVTRKEDDALIRGRGCYVAALRSK
jgi:hypothetical protein